MDSKYTYTSVHALEDLGGRPDDEELTRLVFYYPTYEKAHRMRVLQGVVAGKDPTEIAHDKLVAKGLEHSTARSKQSMGGHVHWAVAKTRRFTIRLLYLRYRLNQRMTRRRANQELAKHYQQHYMRRGEVVVNGKLEMALISRSTIRKATQSPRRDA